MHARSAALQLLLHLSLLTTSGFAQTPAVIEEFDRPFLFTYGSWLNRVQADTNGTVTITQVSNQGGAGYNVNLSLTPHVQDCLALQARIGPNNQAPALRVLLRDESGQTATWEFPLPPTNTPGFTSLYPLDANPLAQPHTTDRDQPLDLTRIRQIQLMGNWLGNLPMDVTLDAILLVPSNPEIETLRQNRQDRLTRLARDQDSELAEARQTIQTDPHGPRIEHLSAATPTTIALTLHEGPTPAHNNDNSFARLTTTTADHPTSYQISSPDDFQFDLPRHPLAVHRKSRPDTASTNPDQASVQHTIYLELPHPLQEGRTYQVELLGINTSTSQISYTHLSRTNTCDTIHASQIGYHPHDPAKTAYLSLWLGNHAPQKFDTLDRFLLLDAASGQPVYGGPIQAIPGTTDHPHARTHVYTLDFSVFQQPGTYRICIPNLGCSQPFPISASAWINAFHTSLKELNDTTANTTSPPSNTDLLHTAYLQLELLDLFPEPTSNNHSTLRSPDLLKSALNNLERVSLPDTPNPVLLYSYTATAARAARILQPIDATRYTDLLQNASQAWHQAQSITPDPESNNAIANATATAAVELYRLTGNPDYHRAFEKTYALIAADPDRARQLQDALFAYTLLPSNRGISILKDRASQSILDTAHAALLSSITSPFGLPSDPEALPITLARAHFRSKDPQHFSTLIRLCSYLAGANPANQTNLTSPLPAPDSSELNATLRRNFTPPLRDWPTTEYSSPNKRTLTAATLLPLTYAHGYLANQTSTTPSRTETTD